MSRTYRPGPQLAAMLLTTLALSALAACGSSETKDTCADSPTFTNDVLPDIVTPKCLPCHTAQLMGDARRGAPDGLDFDTYTSSEPHLADLADAITSGREPPMTSGIATTAAERELVKAWRDCNFKK